MLFTCQVLNQFSQAQTCPFAIIKKDKSHSSLIAIEKNIKGLGENLCNFNKATNGIVLRNIKYIS